MTQIPDGLSEVLADFEFITDRNDWAAYLVAIAERFKEVKVPLETATQPYPEENHVKECESDAYVWAIDQPDGTQQYVFDVLNPQGLSAMAMCVILGETLSGQPLEDVAAVPTDIVFKIFGKDVSMGKGHGLMGIVRMVAFAAKSKLAEQP